VQAEIFIFRFQCSGLTFFNKQSVTGHFSYIRSSIIQLRYRLVFGFFFVTYRFYHKCFFFSNGATAPCGPGPPHRQGFTIILRHTTLGRTPLDERSARRRDLYLTTHNTHNRQTSMPPAGFETAIPASERPQTDAIELSATGIGTYIILIILYITYNVIVCCRE
jgi:hypothetical protein